MPRSPENPKQQSESPHQTESGQGIRLPNTYAEYVEKKGRLEQVFQERQALIPSISKRAFDSFETGVKVASVLSSVQTSISRLENKLAVFEANETELKSKAQAHVDTIALRKSQIEKMKTAPLFPKEALKKWENEVAALIESGEHDPTIQLGLSLLRDATPPKEEIPHGEDKNPLEFTSVPPPETKIEEGMNTENNTEKTAPPSQKEAGVKEMYDVQLDDSTRIQVPSKFAATLARTLNAYLRNGINPTVEQLVEDTYGEVNAKSKQRLYTAIYRLREFYGKSGYTIVQSVSEENKKVYAVVKKDQDTSATPDEQPIKEAESPTNEEINPGGDDQTISDGTGLEENAIPSSLQDYHEALPPGEVIPVFEASKESELSQVSLSERQVQFLAHRLYTTSLRELQKQSVFLTSEHQDVIEKVIAEYNPEEIDEEVDPSIVQKFLQQFVSDKDEFLREHVSTPEVETLLQALSDVTSFDQIDAVLGIPPAQSST